MSLQVWLPLTKDLRQQGVSSVIATNSGATYSSTGGKLGGCYTIAPTSGITLPASTMTSFTTGCSVAFWIKINSWKSSYDTYFQAGLNSTPWAHYRFGILRYNTGSNLCFTITNSSGNSSCASYVTSNLGTGVWYHLAFTYTTGKVRCYINGVLDKEYTTTIVPDFAGITNISIGRCTNGSSYPTDCNMNDFRIYDHCLSPMEVKQVSQGLVLHYPLNRNGWGQENLAKNSLVNISTTSYNTANFNLSEEIVSGASYTATLKGTLGSGKSYYGIWMGGGYTSLGQFTNNNDGTFTMHFTGPSSVAGNGSRTQINVYAVPSSNTNTCTIEWLKLEKGSIATSWCPNSSDALATTMGLNSTTEYDCSGFCNNGTKSGTFSWTSDTPKYEVSTIFNGTEQISTTTPGAEILTLSCWAKTSKNKSTSQFMVADATSEMCISFYSGCIIGFFKVSSTQGTGSRCTLGSAYKENDWNHFVVVKTGAGTRKIYCNGVEQTATSNDYWSAAAGFFVSGRNSSKALPFYGEICDVRAYATTLSASDVKSLYQNCATIDPDGTIRGQIRS